MLRKTAFLFLERMSEENLGAIPGFQQGGGEGAQAQWRVGSDGSQTWRLGSDPVVDEMVC